MKLIAIDWRESEWDIVVFEIFVARRGRMLALLARSRGGRRIISTVISAVLLVAGRSHKLESFENDKQLRALLPGLFVFP